MTKRGLAMNIRTIATLAVAILLGIVAVLLVRNYLSPKPSSHFQAAGGGTAQVVVASTPIARGEALAAPQLKVVDFPVASVPAGSFQSLSQLNGVGPNARLALRPIAANEPILADLISTPGARSILSSALPDGLRAVSFRSNETAGVAGFVLPGDHVDILLTRTISGGERVNAVTQAVAEDILVMAVDQSNDDQADKPVVARTVTVEATPVQAGLITLAQSVGALSMTLRHVSDSAPLQHKVVTSAELGPLAAPKDEPAATVAPPRPVVAKAAIGTSEVHVARGVDVSTYAVTAH